jgi:hypothetical protein
MTATRYIACPTRAPGESGRAFIDRMLAEVNAKGKASAFPIPPVIDTVEPKPKAKPHAPASRSIPVPHSESVASRPSFEPKSSKACPAGDVVLDWRGRPDTRPTTRSWPPGPMGADGRSTHRYVGKWPPKWVSKWTTGPKTKD